MFTISQNFSRHVSYLFGGHALHVSTPMMLFIPFVSFDLQILTWRKRTIPTVSFLYVRKLVLKT